MSKILNAFLQNEQAIASSLKQYQMSVDDIKDIVQETFLRGFAAETKGDIREPKAYLFRIARNLALDKVRRNSLVQIECIEDSGHSSLLLDEGQPMAEEWLDSRRKLYLFTQAVARLPLQCRRAFLMRHVAGYSHKQIANRLNISVSAVEKHLALGLVRCDTYLREHGYEPAGFHSSLPVKTRTAKTVSHKDIADHNG